MQAASPSIVLADGAEENGLAVMLSDLVRQNLEAKPKKRADFDRLRGSVAIVADDADVALTLVCGGGKITIYDGIHGIPDVTIRGGSDAILSLSNFPLSTAFSLPVPAMSDREGWKTLKGVFTGMREGKFHVYGMAFCLPLVFRLTRVMSVNG